LFVLGMEPRPLPPALSAILIVAATSWPGGKMIPTLATRTASRKSFSRSSSCPNGCLPIHAATRRDNARMHHVATNSFGHDLFHFRSDAGTSSRLQREQRGQRIDESEGKPSRPRGICSSRSSDRIWTASETRPAAPCPVSGGSGLPIEPARSARSGPAPECGVITHEPQPRRDSQACDRRGASSAPLEITSTSKRRARLFPREIAGRRSRHSLFAAEFIGDDEKARRSEIRCRRPPTKPRPPFQPRRRRAERDHELACETLR